MNMNTNNNFYTVIYTTIVVVVVAAVLAFVSQSLKERQEANEKADTISQMLTAAQFGSKASFQKIGNSATIAKYLEEISEAYTVNVAGEKVAELPLDKVYSPKELKAQNRLIKNGGDAQIPVFVFKNGTTVLPIYGAGLWGPIWGYIAFGTDNSIIGAYFDHESETAGLGSRIKDDPEFQAQFKAQQPAFGESEIFAIVKGGAPKDASGADIVDNKIDAITGATMTSKGLDEAINAWLGAYSAHMKAQPNTVEE